MECEYCVTLYLHCIASSSTNLRATTPHAPRISARPALSDDKNRPRFMPAVVASKPRFFPIASASRHDDEESLIERTLVPGVVSHRGRDGRRWRLDRRQQPVARPAVAISRRAIAAAGAAAALPNLFRGAAMYVLLPEYYARKRNWTRLTTGNRYRSHQPVKQHPRGRNIATQPADESHCRAAAEPSRSFEYTYSPPRIYNPRREARPGRVVACASLSDRSSYAGRSRQRQPASRVSIPLDTAMEPATSEQQ